ncbi:putative zinc-binding protein [Thalassotalea profundi]|uniref:putative zinc-binding protein n=1 Tax=Thalassotalea profundi TaxID=2036687 RepID=UPI001E2EAF4F|nr:putative zinc-binding protein [Thalassotalea profundi]
MNTKPIVYACTGCSNVARIAHDIALTLDSDGLAEMSCVSGVVGNVAPIKAIAKSGRKIIAIDGCSLSCTKAGLNTCDIKPDFYFTITDLGIDKRDKWQDSLTDNSLAINSIYKALDKEGINFVR